MKQSKKTYETLAETIEGMIEAGDLKGGDRLPPERKLAETYDVSRNTVREALRTLSEKGLLESRTGSGTYVSESALSTLTLSIDEALARKRSRLYDIFEIRKILEPQIAALAAERIGAETLDVLSECITNQEDACNRGQDHRVYDELFHQTLVEATGNKVLAHVYEKIKGILSESRSKDLQSRERYDRSVHLHKEILNAMKDRNPQQAERKMKQHMHDIQRSLELLVGGSRKKNGEAGIHQSANKRKRSS